MVGMLGIPSQFRQHALLVSLSQLQSQGINRAARFHFSGFHESTVAVLDTQQSTQQPELRTHDDALQQHEIVHQVQGNFSTGDQLINRDAASRATLSPTSKIATSQSALLSPVSEAVEVLLEEEEVAHSHHDIPNNNAQPSVVIHLSSSTMANGVPASLPATYDSTAQLVEPIKAEDTIPASTQLSSIEGGDTDRGRANVAGVEANSLRRPSEDGSQLVIPQSQGPINPIASRQLWELVAGSKTVPDCATLIAARANIECRNGDRGQTPLMQACFLGQQEVAATLIRAGADVNAKDLSSNQQTPLLYAVFAGKSHMVDLLVNNGVHRSERDLHGYTALMYAVHYGQPEVAAYLVRDAGCDLWEKDPHGRSAFKLALDKASKDNGQILTCVCRALFDRSQGLPTDLEQLALAREALLLLPHEQCRQLRASMKVHHGDYGLPVFVIDNGSCFIRAGLSTAQPCVFPAVKGSLKGDMMRGFMTQGGATSFLGNEALQKKQLLQLSWPLRKEWDLKFLEEVWDKAFSMCGVDPSECAVVITQPRSFAQEGGQQKIAAMQELLFQRFSVQFVSVVHSAAAASVGTWGLQCPIHLSLHVGYSVATVMVWAEGRPTFTQSKIGGADCTDYLQKNSDWGLGETSAKVWEVVNSIKESKSYCLPYASAVPREEKETWTRPDGTQLVLGSELASAAEVLFDPNLMGKRSFGLSELVRTAIQSSASSIHATLWNNIVVTGGSTLFPGFDERLVHELKQLDRSQCGGNCPIRIVNDSGTYRSESAWQGASSLFLTPAYFGCLVDQDEFEESSVLLNKVRVDGCDSLASFPTLETR